MQKKVTAPRPIISGSMAHHLAAAKRRAANIALVKEFLAQQRAKKAVFPSRSALWRAGAKATGLKSTKVQEVVTARKIPVGDISPQRTGRYVHRDNK